MKEVAKFSPKQTSTHSGTLLPCRYTPSIQASLRKKNLSTGPSSSIRYLSGQTTKKKKRGEEEIIAKDNNAGTPQTSGKTNFTELIGVAEKDTQQVGVSLSPQLVAH
jgi:hypothetical protein